MRYVPIRSGSALRIAGLIALTVAVFTGAQASWLYGKALIAQRLLENAWNVSTSYGIAQKPWTWADISTTARLSIPSLNEHFIVLSDASGEAMAFGPGLVAGNPMHGDTQTLAIGGHRDTHLAFLEHVPIGALLTVENMAGQTFGYTLMDKQVVDSRTHNLTIADQQPGLVLITCYPFHARQTGGPLRLVVRAAPV